MASNLKISLEITNLCSASCRFCGRTKLDLRPKGHMGDEVFRQFLRLLSNYEDKEPVIALSTHYGDVLCYPDLSGIIKKIARVKGVSGVSFFTNGILLDKPFDSIKKHQDYKYLGQWAGHKNIKFLTEWDDFQGTIRQKDLPVGASFRLPPPKGKMCRHLSRRLLVWRDGEVGVGCRPHREFIVGNVFDHLPLQHMVYGPVQNIRRDWEDGKYPAPCVDCISYQPNRVSLRYRIKSNYQKFKAAVLRRAFI